MQKEYKYSDYEVLHKIEKKIDNFTAEDIAEYNEWDSKLIFLFQEVNELQDWNQYVCNLLNEFSNMDDYLLTTPFDTLENQHLYVTIEGVIGDILENKAYELVEKRSKELLIIEEPTR